MEEREEEKGRGGAKGGCAARLLHICILSAGDCQGHKVFQLAPGRIEHCEANAIWDLVARIGALLYRACHIRNQVAVSRTHACV